MMMVVMMMVMMMMLLMMMLLLLLLLLLMMMMMMMLKIPLFFPAPSLGPSRSRRTASKSLPKRKSGSRGSRRSPGSQREGSQRELGWSGSIIFHPFPAEVGIVVVCVCICTYNYKIICICSYVYIYIHIYIHIYIYIYIYHPIIPNWFLMFHPLKKTNALTLDLVPPGANDWCLGPAHAKPKPGTWCHGAILRLLRDTERSCETAQFANIIKYLQHLIYIYRFRTWFI